MYIPFISFQQRPTYPDVSSILSLLGLFFLITWTIIKIIHNRFLIIPGLKLFLTAAMPLLLNDSFSELHQLLFFCQISQDSILLSFPSDNPRCYLRSILSVPTKYRKSSQGILECRALVQGTVCVWVGEQAQLSPVCPVSPKEQQQRSSNDGGNLC